MSFLGDLLSGASGRRVRLVSPEAVERVMAQLRRKVRRCGITRQALRAGMLVELEHRDVTHGNLLQTARIAAAHLCESPLYYSELAKLERRLKRLRA